MPDSFRNKGFLKRVFQFAIHKLDDPRPSWALKPVTPTRLPGPTLGGGVAVPAQPSQPSPAPVKSAPLVEIVPAFTKAAQASVVRTPEENARLERGAELRRKLDAERERPARDGQAQDHKESVERLQRRLNTELATPEKREAAQASLAQQHAAEIHLLDTFFAERTAATEAAITQAYEDGYFSDTLETMLSAAFEHAAREADRNAGGHGDGRSPND